MTRTVKTLIFVSKGSLFLYCLDFVADLGGQFLQPVLVIDVQGDTVVLPL